MIQPADEPPGGYELAWLTYRMVSVSPSLFLQRLGGWTLGLEPNNFLKFEESKS